MASILIIDDEVAIATAFAMFFRHDGKHQVAESNEQQRGRPAVKVLDVMANEAAHSVTS